MKDVILNLINAMGAWGFSLFLIAISVVVVVGVIGIFHDVNDNPNHWSRQGDIHDWLPRKDS